MSTLPDTPYGNYIDFETPPSELGFDDIDPDICHRCGERRGHYQPEVSEWLCDFCYQEKYAEDEL